MKLEPTETKISIIKSFFNALENKNSKELVELFSNNAKFTRPQNSLEFPYCITGKEHIKNYWNSTFKNYGFSNFTIEEVNRNAASDTVMVKYIVDMIFKTDATVNKTLTFASFVFNKNGKIEKYVEIFYPLVKTAI
ncbi:hypothetical protein PK35_10150 [Tamlana nanhaiensis]|uniref:SnoaL-like domain-containing protein n=1 Tax=Neotamlana nanhaiensis TaxID=1382798 RepID=A0A0D7W1H9_9FLAO|nr:nuclear transport factor 2 family protein [Tamlana nanhaiensis]KJD32558.1 hypothetical protein PK35_10150 [Tamlana nanhaiensis]